jgi:hypothetical protein
MEVFNWLKSQNNKNDSIVETKTKDILPTQVNNEKVTTLKTKKLTIDECKALSDTKALEYLKIHWNIKKDEPIVVWGEIKKINLFYKLINVKKMDGHVIEYPIKDLEDKQKISYTGISISALNSSIKKYYDQGIRYISCQLVLESISKRKKNPLIVKVDSHTIKPLQEIATVNTIKTKNHTLLIENSIVNHYAAIRKQEIYDKNMDMEKKHIRLREEIERLNKEIEEQEDVVKSEKKSSKELQLEIEKKNHRVHSLNIELKKVKIELDNLKDIQMKKIEKLRSFIKAKADLLLNLEFIDKNQYNEILGIKNTAIKVTEKFLDFSKDLNGNYSQAISQIQAYLFKKDIIYPKYVLENYFSLVKTNDLIILAGDSGSGKTNLVKAFADAVGGVSKIIPVKPSWTSSEDLLGYYNPLQKTYLSTPFLEALIEASQNPEIPYFICLDEMNLARVEYYFADFLSVLEERDIDPEIFLYSDEESNHVLSEFNNVIQAIEGLKEKYKKNDITSFYDILKDSQINTELKEILGLSDKVSLISYHSTLRRMLGGILNTPSSIVFPRNVRIIGAINIDETTHYLSPKVLDRAHVIKFDNPLLSDWSAIEDEINSSNIENPDYKIRFSIDQFGERKLYPKFSTEDKFCMQVVELTKDYLKPLGVEMGLRTIRQGLNYNESFLNFNSNEHIALNNFILHKILPKFTFDGSTTVGNKEKLIIVDEFKMAIKDMINEEIEGLEGRSAIKELDEMLQKSKENDSIVQYWA